MLCLPHEIKHLDKIEELVKQPIPRLEIELPSIKKASKQKTYKKIDKQVQKNPTESHQELKDSKTAQTKSSESVKSSKDIEDKVTQKDTQKLPVKGLGEHIPAFLLR
jgi:hypothetical protein